MQVFNKEYNVQHLQSVSSATKSRSSANTPLLLSNKILQQNRIERNDGLRNGAETRQNNVRASSNVQILFINAKTQKKSRCPLVDRWIQYAKVCINNEILLQMERTGYEPDPYGLPRLQRISMLAHCDSPSLLKQDELPSHQKP